MLHEFLTAERQAILDLSDEKVALIADSKHSSDELESGLPAFYDERIAVLQRAKATNPDGEWDPQKDRKVAASISSEMVARHGTEAFRLGYTVSQVVHGYGALCQAITEHATSKRASISPQEFNLLNLSLDIAIADAVTQFDRVQHEHVQREEAKRLGFLAHELRNALSNAVLAYSALKGGHVGVAGSTSRVIEESHKAMREIIDRSLSEVRLRSEPVVERARLCVFNIVSGIEATALIEANAKSVRLLVDVPPELHIFADRHFIVSAIANLVHNALEFTVMGSTVSIRAVRAGERVLIEIEDQCGGLPTVEIDRLFQPFSQEGLDRSGVGLGLAICRRAVALNEGQLTARDVPGQGCVFTIDLPRAA